MKIEQEAFKKLVAFKVERGYPLARISEMIYGPGLCTPSDERAPFFTEAFLYNLLGKDDARHLLAMLSDLGFALGFPVNERYGLP